jgi:hypothetical protein
MLQGSLQGQVVTRGQLPTGASNNMSVEPTTFSQGIAVLGSGFDLGQEQIRQQHRGPTHSQPI